MFKSTNFESHADIKEFFEQYLHDGESTLQEVEDFLQETGLSYSKIQVDELPWLPSSIDFNTRSHIQEYDTYFVFRLPRHALKPPSLRQRLRFIMLKEFPLLYSVYFLLKNDLLVQTYVRGDYRAL